MHNTTFPAMASAPRDAAIEVQHGGDQETALAVWSSQWQVWIWVDDPLRKSLHCFTAWRPAA